MQGVFEIVAAAAGGAQGAEGGGAEAGCCGAVAGGVGDREPGAVAVLDEVEPVTADFVGREEAAGELGAGDAGDPRREQVLLDLGRRGGGFAPPRGFDDVGVVVREFERGGPLFGDVVEWRDRLSDTNEQGDNPPA